MKLDNTKSVIGWE